MTDNEKRHNLRTEWYAKMMKYEKNGEINLNKAEFKEFIDNSDADVLKKFESGQLVECNYEVWKKMCIMDMNSDGLIEPEEIMREIFKMHDLSYDQPKDSQLRKYLGKEEEKEEPAKPEPSEEKKPEQAPEKPAAAAERKSPFG